MPNSTRTGRYQLGIEPAGGLAINELRTLAEILAIITLDQKGEESRGVNYRNETFEMKRSPESEEEGDETPNFHFFQTDLKIWWDGDIYLLMYSNRPVSEAEILEIFQKCRRSLEPAIAEFQKQFDHKIAGQLTQQLSAK